MWGSLLGLALLISLNPVLLGFILLVIARPRPVQNLFVYWVGAMTMNVPVFLAPLVLIHFTASASFAQSLATSEQAPAGTIRPLPLVIAAVLFAIVAVMSARLRRAPAKVPAGGGGASEIADESAPALDAPAQGGAKGVATAMVSAIRRFLSRLTTAWENGSLWMSFVFGMMYLPSATLVLLIDSTILASGVGFGEQIIAAIAFVVGFLAVLEIVLVSCLIAPTKTEIVLRPVHEWARTHNRQILIVFFAVIALWQLARAFSLA